MNNQPRRYRLVVLSDAESDAAVNGPTDTSPDDCVRPHPVAVELLPAAREPRTCAPFRSRHSALGTITFGQAVAICSVGLAPLLGLLFYGKGLLTTALAVISALYLGGLLLIFVFSSARLRKAGRGGDQR